MAAISENEGEEPDVQVFYADPVDDDGNVIGTVTSMDVRFSHGTAHATKIPHDEMALEDADLTFHAKIPEADDDL